MTEQPIATEPDPGGGAPPPTAQRSFVERFVAALKLDPTVYEEVEHDPDALGQAALVVTIAALAGALVGVGHGGFFAGLVQAYFGWLLWAAIVWIVGVKLLGHTSDFGELLRTLGFVAAPQALWILAVVPIRPWRLLVFLVVLVMTVLAFFRAVRAALDVDTAGAWLAVGLAVLAQIVLGMAMGGMHHMY